jgi:hypothetical protein
VSWVTHVIVSFSLLEDESRVLEALNAWDGLRGRRFAPFGFDQAHGGDKGWSRPMATGAFNYIDESELLAHVRAMVWADPGAVQVFLNGEEEPDDADRWRVVALT